MGSDIGPSPESVLTRKDFGRTLTALREAAGLTVRELARKADVPSGTLSGWCTGRHLPTLTQKAMFLRLLVTCGVTGDGETEEWVSCWLRLRRPLGQKSGESPYRGLESFQVEHSGWFFGRSRLTGTLVDRLTGSSGLMIVVGPSGSGKSSVLRAGLMATLCGDGWRGVVLTPGPHPLEALETGLASVGDEDLVVLVDQFEEIFTVCTDQAEREAFLAALEALCGRGGGIRVVAGMRADFYADALRSPLLAKALQDNQVTVGPMTDDELRQSIVEPARVAGMELEEGLPHVLLRDLAPVGGAEQVSALPLLSHALLATWEQGERRTMTVADYTATGGIHSAIARTADAVFAGLSPDDQALARRLFLRLVRVGDTTPDTRRRVQLDELAGGREEDRIREVLGRYVDRRLITAGADGVEISHEALLQAWPQLREWIDTDRAGHRLHRQLTEAAGEWQDAGRDPGVLYRGVRLDAAVDWVTDQGRRGELNQLEQQFVDAGVEQSRAERLRERRRTRRLRWLAVALGALLLLSASATAYSVQQRAIADRERNSAISRQVAGTANRLRDSDPALAAQLAVAAYRIAPTVEARSSVLTASGSPAVTRMLRPGGAPQSVAVNAAGTLLAAAGAAPSDTAVLVWDLKNPDRPALLGPGLTGHTASVWATAFSPDGTTVATGSDDDTVRLWDVTDPLHPNAIGSPLLGARGDVITVEFSPDGSLLAAGSRDKVLRLWDVRDRERPVLVGSLTGSEGEVRSIAFSPSGKVVAIADENRAVRLWDVAGQRPLGAPLALSSRANTVVFSPDGKTLAAGSNDGSVKLWTVTDPSAPVAAGQLTRPTGWINAIAFSADGTTLAAASAAASVQVWNLATRTLLVDLPHAEPVITVAFREHDEVLYTNSADGIARRWRVPGPVLPTAQRNVTGLDYHPDKALLVGGAADLQLVDVTNTNRPRPVGPPLTAPERLVGTVTISPDGRTVAAAARTANVAVGNDVVLWDITTPERPGPPVRLSGHTALIKHVSYNRRGDLLASAGEDGTVRLWNLADGAQQTVLKPGTGFVFAVEFSLDDRLMVAVTQDGHLALWDVRDPRNPTLLGKPIAVAGEDARSLAISPDSRTLAIGIADGSVRLWDITDPAAPAQLGSPITGPDGYIHDVVFDLGGSLLIGGGAGQTWLWNVADLRRPETLAILQLPKTITWRTQFSPDGRTLATANGSVHLWDIDAERVIERICATAGDRIAEFEWDKHVPGATYRPICPGSSR